MSPNSRPARCRTDRALGGMAGCVLLLVIAALAAVGGTGVTATASSAGGVTVTGSGVGPRLVAPGDTIAAGWGVSMPENHRPQVVSLSSITATIGLVCGEGSWRGATSLVIHLPPTAVTIPENATGWLPTSDPAAPAGFQAVAAVPPACGSISPLLVTGVAYAATLTSVDVTDAVAVRFHALDTPPGHPDSDGDGDDHTPYGGCDGHTWSWDTPQCVAGWTAAVTVHAVAPPAVSSPSPIPSPTHGPGSGSGPSPTPAPRPVPGSTSGSAPGPPARGSSPARPATAAPRPAAAGAAGAAAAATTPRDSTSAPPPPALVPHRPQTSTVLGPVPLMVPPVIGSAVAQLAPALPWAWFAVLAIVDTVLVVSLVARSRRRRAGTLSGR